LITTNTKKPTTFSPKILDKPALTIKKDTKIEKKINQHLKKTGKEQNEVQINMDILKK